MKFEEISSLSQDIKGAPSDLRQFLATEPFRKWWKILFISPQKIFSFPNLCLHLLVM